MKIKNNYKQILTTHIEYLKNEIQSEMNLCLNHNDDIENFNHMYKITMYQKILIRLLEKCQINKTTT